MEKIEAIICKVFSEQGFNGRFGPGLPRVSDGPLLFLLQLISKMRHAKDGGSRFGMVLNDSPLFTGGAGSSHDASWDASLPKLRQNHCAPHLPSWQQRRQPILGLFRLSRCKGTLNFSPKGSDGKMQIGFKKQVAVRLEYVINMALLL
jgi:hypothetical protein